MVTGLATETKEGKTMGYRKARIPIQLCGENQVDYRDGYKFDVCFSNGELFEMGVYKRHDRGKTAWVISDLNTGLAVNYGRTRVDAVTRFLYMHLSKLERVVLHNADNMYSEKTAEFQAMLKEGAK